MRAYVGETVIAQSESKFRNFTASDWAMYFISRYGQTDGGHHKAWVLDQVSRILKGTGIEIKIASWSDGYIEYRVSTVEPPSQEYIDWVQEMLGTYDVENECYEYGYDEGIAP